MGGDRFRKYASICERKAHGPLSSPVLGSRRSLSERQRKRVSRNRPRGRKALKWARTKPSPSTTGLEASCGLACRRKPWKKSDCRKPHHQSEKPVDVAQGKGTIAGTAS